MLRNTSVTSGNNVIINFNVGPHQYIVVLAYTSADNNIEVKFALRHLDGSTTVETTGEAGHEVSLKVFATLADILKHALNRWPNARITFTGYGESKVKLYRMLGKRIAKILNRKYDERGGDGWIGVILTPK